MTSKGFEETQYLDIFNFIIANKKGTSSFPKDSEFRGDFIYKDIYSLKANRYILSQLELFISNKEKVEINDDISIEHIMPQALNKNWKEQLGNEWQRIHETYLHTIGNLTLTGYNSELSNETFDRRKKDILTESKFHLNQYFKTCNSWNEEDIKKRAETIIDEIVMNIWKYPEVNEKILDSFEETYSIDDDVSVTKKRPIRISFYQDRDVVSWQDILVVFFEQLKINESNKFELLLSEHTDEKIKKIINTSKQNLRKDSEILPSIFIETNLSANDILNNIKTNRLVG